jgi:hypothetical protein
MKCSKDNKSLNEKMPCFVTSIPHVGNNHINPHKSGNNKERSRQFDFQNSSCKSLNFFITEFWGEKSVNYAMQALQLSKTMMNSCYKIQTCFEMKYHTESPVTDRNHVKFQR